MVERDLTRHPPPEEAEGVRPQGLEHQGRGETVAPAPTPPQRQGQTARPDPVPEVADRVAVPTAESLSLERRTIETQLPEVAPLGTVPPLAMPSVEPLLWQTRSLDTRVPAISPTMTPAVPLGFPAALPRLAFQPAILSQALPQVTPYTFTPTGLPFPSVFPVRLVPSRFTQALAFPSAQPGPSVMSVPQPAVDQADTGEEGGEGNGAGVGLLDILFEIRAGASGASGLLLGGRPWVILAEQDPDGERYEGLLLYLLAEVLRCTCTSASPRVQVPSRTSLEEWATLADGRITFIPAEKRPDDDRLLERLRDLTASREAFVVLSEASHSIERLSNEIDDRVVGASLCHVRLNRSGKDSLTPALQIAFGHLSPIVLPGDRVDTVGAVLEDRFYQRLASYVNRVAPELRRRSPGGIEGTEHYLTKLYLAWLYRRKSPKTECAIVSQGPVADVFVEADNICWEIETLYGTGDPLAKLNETTDKYRDHPFVEVRIVIPNFTALLYLPQLLRFERYRIKERGGRFSLWTLDFSKDNPREEAGLRRLRDVAAELRRLSTAEH